MNETEEEDEERQRDKGRENTTKSRQQALQELNSRQLNSTETPVTEELHKQKEVQETHNRASSNIPTQTTSPTMRVQSSRQQLVFLFLVACIEVSALGFAVSAKKW